MRYVHRRFYEATHYKKSFELATKSDSFNILHASKFLIIGYCATIKSYLMAILMWCMGIGEARSRQDPLPCHGHPARHDRRHCWCLQR